jgi:SAM-dependent methyltransferase
MIISEIDNKHYKLIRQNVDDLLKSLTEEYDKENFLILDIAPEIHKGAKGFFKKAKIKTLDIDSASNADYIADICSNNSDIIPSNLFDLIFCTEVLEHTNNPFIAVNEIERILKPNGIVAVSTPFNFRIHGPLPDNWRFTIHGLKQLFSNFSIIEIKPLEDNERNLMPIQYTLLAKKTIKL